MKNNKGITLMSLVIYIALIFVVLAILMRITTYFNENISQMADVSFETEFNKLNIYLLDESKKSKNDIQEITEDGAQITFSNGNKYTYNAESKIIYLNNNIKICENIESCLFEQKIAENGKDILSLTIKIGDIEKTVNYIITGKNETLLPAEYQEVEYIESTGTQYIITNILDNADESLEYNIDIQVDERNTRGCFGANDGSYISFVNNRVYAIWESTFFENDYERHTITIKNYKEEDATYFYLDSIFKCKVENGKILSGNTFLLFAVGMDASGTVAYNSKCKLYSLDVVRDDVLIGNFIPCYRKSDNIIGLYDTVNNKFYTNAGTGTFLKGEDKNTVIASNDENFINEEDYIFNMETEGTKLPIEYQQVEYIQSTGTQYIDTGVSQNEISEISGRFQLTSLGSNHQGICGRYTSNSTSINMVYNANTGEFGYRWGDASYNISSDLKKHSFTINSQSITIDDTIISTYSGNSVSDTDTLVIFARRTDNSGSAIINLASMKLYKFQIKSNDIIVRNFIPCYRKSDNVVGLYDTANDVLYTNAGTGVFTAGPNVN